MQMQEQIQNQTRNLFSGFPFPGFPVSEAQAGESEVPVEKAAKK
jgi:hypothetical protein